MISLIRGIKKPKINAQIKQNEAHRYREQIDDCQLGGGLGSWVLKVNGLRCTNCQL